MKWLAVLLLGLSACAASKPRPELDSDFGARPIASSHEIPFIPQTPKLCGPTALRMAMNRYRPELSLEEISTALMSPKAKGTFKQDLLAGARRFGLATYEVPTVYEMIDHLAEGTPVILFHNAGFFWKEYWHYSVMTGYDLRERNFYLHIGERESFPMKMEKVLESWDQGGNWAYVVVSPNRIPKFGTLEEALDNALVFLRIGLVDPARALGQQIAARWPDAYQADVILADAFLKLNRRALAYKHLKEAARKNPANQILKQKVRDLRNASLGRPAP